MPHASVLEGWDFAVVSRFGFLAGFAGRGGLVGVLRLRSCFVSRSGYSAQDDVLGGGGLVLLRRVGRGCSFSHGLRRGLHSYAASRLVALRQLTYCLGTGGNPASFALPAETRQAASLREILGCNRATKIAPAKQKAGRLGPALRIEKLSIAELS